MTNETGIGTETRLKCWVCGGGSRTPLKTLPYAFDTCCRKCARVATMKDAIEKVADLLFKAIVSR